MTNAEKIVPLVPGQKDHKTDLAYYHPASLMYEVNRLVGITTPYAAWHNESGQFNGYWQDPYRRLVFGETEEKLVAANTLIDAYLHKAITEADVLFCTVTLTEAWRMQNGYYTCTPPGYGGGGGTNLTFNSFGYLELEAQLMRLAITAGRLHKLLVMAVCPVPLGKTYQPCDHLSANFEGKALLRTVIGEITRRFKHVVYFPVYEFLQLYSNGTAEDGRHVVPQLCDLSHQFWDSHFV